MMYALARIVPQVKSCVCRGLGWAAEAGTMGRTATPPVAKAGDPPVSEKIPVVSRRNVTHFHQPHSVLRRTAAHSEGGRRGNHRAIDYYN